MNMDKVSYGLTQKTERTMRRYGMLEHTKHILVGLSGGIDSVCLLSVLHALQEPCGFELMAAHVNHKLRGTAADEDEAFVRALCQKWHIPLFVRQEDVKSLAAQQKLSLEEAGRRVRYDFFEEIRRDNPHMKIATAHHKNDQAETVLLNLMRGAGLQGLSGIPYVRGFVIRPFLNVSRYEIEQYCQENHLSYREDESNHSLQYKRNCVRHILLPKCQEYNPNMVDTLSNNARFLQKDQQFIKQELNRHWQECLISSNDNGILFHKDGLCQLPFAMVSRLLKRVEDLWGVSLPLSYDKIESFIHFLSKPTGTKWQLDSAIYAQMNSDSVAFYRCGAPTVTEFCDLLLLNQPLYIGPIHQYLLAELVSEREKLTGNSAIFVDADLVSFPLEVRSRRVGDVFYPTGMDGKKTVKKYLTDQKIKKDDKNAVPIILSQSQVVWIGGMRQDRRFLPSSRTKSLLKIQLWKE